jgi:anti-anti-sigma factor
MSHLQRRDRFQRAPAFSPRAFKLIERQPAPDCLEILVEGELDLAVSERLRHALAKATACRCVVVDLEQCEFIDLSAVEILVEARVRARAAEGRELSIFGAKGQVRRLFALTGTATFGDRPLLPPPDRAAGPGSGSSVPGFRSGAYAAVSGRQLTGDQAAPGAG